MMCNDLLRPFSALPGDFFKIVERAAVLKQAIRDVPFVQKTRNRGGYFHHTKSLQAFYFFILKKPQVF